MTSSQPSFFGSKVPSMLSNVELNLSNTITHRMVRCSPALLYVGHVTKFPNHLALKIPTLIAMQSPGKSIMNEKVLVQYMSSCLCCLITCSMKLSLTTTTFSIPPFVGSSL